MWEGISLQGRTGICVFEGIMDAPSYMYTGILEQTLIPFINDVMPESHKFMADNDPKHTSRLAKQFIEEKAINWWRTPAESPDLNPTETLWHGLKEYTTKQALINGIVEFWATVGVAKCTKYIRHLRKVILKVIELEGAATGY